MSDEHERRDDVLDERLRRALRDEQASPPFPEAAIEARIRSTVARSAGGSQGQGTGRARPPWWQGPTFRAALAAAASLVLFIGGAEYGRRTALGGVSPTPPSPTAGVADERASESLPLSIQSAGTRYVAEVARFSGESSSLTPREREMARQVALAVLYGATLELLEEAQDDELLRTIAETVVERRARADADAGSGVMEF